MDYDDEFTESVSDTTREHVFERDGHACWLCKHETTLHIAHQIDAAASRRFSVFQDNGTIPSKVTDPSHIDNLFPLCPNCHGGYDAVFPEWILIPDTETLQKYIDHEKIDYEERLFVSQNPSIGSVPLRSLPFINRHDVLYHPLIISQKYQDFLGSDRRHPPQWPKRWLGEPTTTIHRAARRGLFESTPTQLIQLPGRCGRPGRAWQTGVPEIFWVLVGELIRLWARPKL